MIQSYNVKLTLGCVKNVKNSTQKC